MEGEMEKHQIRGLIYLPLFINKQEEEELSEFIIQKQWNTSLKRRTQHYGYTYSYDHKNTLEKAEEIPGIFIVFKKKVEAYIKEHLDAEYQLDQIIVNEYLPGQGISPHIDNQKLFGKIVASLSLNSDTIMVFERETGEKVEKMLQRRSLFILSSESREKWKHSIPSRKSDQGVPRKTRYSLTFRKVIKS